ncbi:MAG TPA: hypothetical protein VFT49_03545 [Candidatus Saccharimonadales bacterium]|nr:hypothetical protein [Candidatus Saccharimonadales bacterium]
MLPRLFAAVRSHVFITVLVAVFLLIGIAFSVTWYRYQLNPDASSYFTIAYKYAHFNIKDALNGYWSPLLSWLLVPAVWLHIGLSAAAKILTIFISGIILTIVYAFLVRRGSSKTLATMVCLFLAALLLDWGMVGPITPDLLMALMILMFTLLLNSYISLPTRNKALLLGASGALMYYAKGLGFYLFLFCLLAVVCWQWLLARKELKKYARLHLIALASFLVICAPFIIAVSAKYNAPTISTAGSLDHKVFGPYYQGNLYPELFAGPLPPPNASAVTPGEDPGASFDLSKGAWSPLSSSGNFKYFMKSVVWNNGIKTLNFFKDFGVFIVLATVITLIGCLKQTTYRREFVIFSLVGVLLCLGYCLIYTEARYVEAAVFLALLGAGLWLSSLQKRNLLNQAQIIVTGLLVAGFASISTAHAINQNRYVDRAQSDLAASLKADLPPGSNIISDQYSSYFVCYYLKLHCYGNIYLAGQNDDQYYQKIKDSHITYYLDYHSQDSDSRLNAFVTDYFNHLRDQAWAGGTLSIYKIN